MKIKIIDGQMTINVADLVDHLSDEDRQTIVQHVAWNDKLFEMVIGRLLGETIWDGWYSIPDYKAHELREKIIALNEPIARKCVERLIQERETAKAEAKSLHDWAWAMYHAWPDHLWQSRPQQTKFEYTRAPDAETVTAEMNTV